MNRSRSRLGPSVPTEGPPIENRPVDAAARRSGGRINRREAIATLIALGASPLTCFAQQTGRTYHIGVLFSGGSDTMQPHRDVVREQLAKQGFIEGRNLQMTWRGGSEIRHDDRGIAQELVAARPDAILAFTAAMTQAVQWATKSIPIVFTHLSDPVADGIVKDYARPGGNTTGVATHQRELLAKRFELLRELLPTAKRVALLAPNSFVDTAFFTGLATAKEVSVRLNFELIVVPVYFPREIDEKRPEAMIVFASLGQRLTIKNVIDVAAKLRIPAIFPDAESVRLGGFASYGTDPLEDTRLGAELLGRVLNGAKPGDQAVYQNSRFVLALNVKTTKALGITVPPSILLRVDQLIE
jgi:putative ABC transport system substrate-binding protein